MKLDEGERESRRKEGERWSEREKRKKPRGGSCKLGQGIPEKGDRVVLGKGGVGWRGVVRGVVGRGGSHSVLQ